MVRSDSPQITIQYDALALHSGYLRLQTRTQITQEVLLFHGKKKVKRTRLNVTFPRTFPVLLATGTTQIHCVSKTHGF